MALRAPRQTKRNINLPLAAPIPSMMQDKANKIVMIPFPEANSNTPGNTRTHSEMYRSAKFLELNQDNRQT